MVSRRKLGAARCARIRRLIPLVAALLLAPVTFAAPAAPQEITSDASRLSAAQRAFDAGHWEEAAKLAKGPATQSSELDFLQGLALAKLQRFDQAGAAFEVGHRKSPGDSRFLVELAGVNYKQHDIASAKRNLLSALRIAPQDAYSREFLGTLYFIEGNLEAALKYWNPAGKPRLRAVAVQPPPKVDSALLQRAIGFSAPQILSADALLAAEARVQNLGIYPQQRVELIPVDAGNYDFTWHLPEREGWSDSRLAGALTLLSGLPYQTIYPEFYDLRHEALNVTSLLRWDAQKRRASAEISAPFFGNPARRWRIYFDAREENWNLTSTLFDGGPPLAGLYVRHIAAGAEFRSIVNSRWSWNTGLEVANHDFGNLLGHDSAAEKPFFTPGNSLVYWLRADRCLLRIPERRFTVDSWAEARVGRTFATGADANGLGAFGTLRGSLLARWFPRATGDDYEMYAQFRAGDTLGLVPFDELFQLGIERDNDLWLRGHAGTTDGRKGAAPLGRRYALINWEMDKNVYGNGFFTVKLGPFLDNGAIADPSGLFGSRQWLWDTGAQCKVRLLGSVTVVLSYGRDLRGGRNVFYGTALH